MSVSSSETIEDTALPDGRRRIRWRFVMHTGQELIVGPKRVVSGFVDATERAAFEPVTESWFDFAEQDEAVGYVEAGGNPIDKTDNPIHSTQKKLAKKLVYWLMSLKNDPILPQAVKWLKPLLDDIALLTNIQIENFLDITSGQRIRMQQIYKDIINTPDPCASASIQIDEAHDSADETWGEP